jgi:hypothetical protein
MQYSRIYTDAKSAEIYTSMANLCVTPAFLAKLTDTDDDVSAVLRYRAYEVHGF